MVWYGLRFCSSSSFNYFLNCEIRKADLMFSNSDRNLSGFFKTKFTKISSNYVTTILVVRSRTVHFSQVLVVVLYSVCITNHLIFYLYYLFLSVIIILSGMFIYVKLNIIKNSLRFRITKII